MQMTCLSITDVPAFIVLLVCPEDLGVAPPLLLVPVLSLSSSSSSSNNYNNSPVSLIASRRLFVDDVSLASINSKLCLASCAAAQDLARTYCYKSTSQLFLSMTDTLR